MAYAKLNSPLPNLTMQLGGCCGSRRIGLGDGEIDTSSDYGYSDLAPVTDPITLPENTLSPLVSVYSVTDDGDGSVLPLPPPGSLNSVESYYPSSVGTEFVGNGDGTYTNIQTGQVVPFSVAQAITQATAMPTTASGSPAIDTTGTETGVNLVDPTTGQSYSGTLTSAAQVLQATGGLVTAAGKLTAAGQALAAQGQLIAPPAGIGTSVSSALSSLSTWFTNQSMVSGFANWEVLAGIGLVGVIVSSYISSRPTKRKRR